MSYKKKYIKKNKLKTRDLATKFVVYDYENGIYIELNESAKRIWSLLDNMSLDDIIDNYSKHYDIDAKTAKSDVVHIIDELEGRGLLKQEGVS